LQAFILFFYSVFFLWEHWCCTKDFLGPSLDGN